MFKNEWFQTEKCHTWRWGSDKHEKSVTYYLNNNIIIIFMVQKNIVSWLTLRHGRQIFLPQTEESFRSRRNRKDNFEGAYFRQNRFLFLKMIVQICFIIQSQFSIIRTHQVSVRPSDAMNVPWTVFAQTLNLVSKSRMRFEMHSQKRNFLYFTRY